MGDRRMSAEELEFEGVPIKLGRTTYVLPPLALGAIKRHAAQIQKFGELSLNEQMDLTSAIALAALKRNYPDMTLERVDALVDLRNMGDVFAAVVQSSGFTAQTPGKAAGEAAPPTGQPSTPT
ncbi:MAG: hypothetical protein EOO21_05145 [Comamonadaceae bacterium]|nr:MAG: hypothetical protein EOO21_05145 [Comamonadaceae bacterium]